MLTTPRWSFIIYKYLTRNLPRLTTHPGVYGKKLLCVPPGSQMLWNLFGQFKVKCEKVKWRLVYGNQDENLQTENGTEIYLNCIEYV